MNILHNRFVSKVSTLHQTGVAIFTSFPALCYVSGDFATDHKPDSGAGLIFHIFLSTVLCALSLYNWVKLFDHRPCLIIDNEGVWTKRFNVPFSKLRLLPFEHIQSFNLVEKRRRGIMYVIRIHLKKDQGYQIIDPYDLDKEWEEILSVLRRYSVVHDFRELAMTQG